MNHKRTSSYVVRGDGQRLPPPTSHVGWLGAIRQSLFANPTNVVFTLLAATLLLLIIPPLLRWAILDAIWYTTDPTACRTIAGACWAVVAEKYRVILFGTYPYTEQWRGALVVGLITLLAIVTAIPRCWKAWLIGLWFVTATLCTILMFGGVFGLRYVSTASWGGLPLTMIVFLITVGLGLPLAIVLALGRRSELPVVRMVCIGIIEIVRGLPLVSVLFMMIIFVPLFLPSELTIDKLLRALIGMVIFFGAYAAEVVRGGLQAIPIGQYDAARALGLRYWPATARIILPQALRIVIPALMNDIIRAFKNTTFVSIIGIFDVLGATKASMRDVDWVRYATEAYIFVALLFFIYCFSMSKYSEFIARRLERK